MRICSAAAIRAAASSSTRAWTAFSTRRSYARRLFFLNAGCVHDARGSVDQAYVERMHNLLDGMRPGVKPLLLAFERGTRRISSGRHRFIPIVATPWRRCRKRRARARAR
jgi:hypothetical protein